MTLTLVTGLFSYGFQFELKQGQWNLIAFLFSVAAIYLFHQQPKYRWAAYLLFSISVQLKLFPAIFVFTLIDDFTDWKNNAKRIIGLGILNILALFIFGFNPILATIGSLSRTDFFRGSPNNLSLASFILFFLTIKDLLPRGSLVLWLLRNNWLLQLLFLALFGFCLLSIFFQAHKRKAVGFNPYIFLACIVGACIIPSISYNYKLSMLPASIAISVPEILLNEEGKNRPLIILLAFIFSIAYSSMLYSYINKPEILQNNFPALMLILIICTILSCIKPNKPTRNSAANSKI